MDGERQKRDRARKQTDFRLQNFANRRLILMDCGIFYARGYYSFLENGQA